MTAKADRSISSTPEASMITACRKAREGEAGECGGCVWLNIEERRR